MKKIFALALVASAGLAYADSVEFYGGDLDGRNGLADELNTVVSDAYVFDDFNHAGGTITGLFGNYLTNMGQISGYTWEIRQGVSVGNGGTLVASGGGSAASWSPTGNSAFGLPEYQLVVPAGVNLAAGTYFLGIRPAGFGGQFGERAFMSTTSGAGGIGSPIANGNAFFQSGFFGVNFGNVSDQLGAETWDFSQGVIVPAPTAAALLGLGGLVAGRRRR